MYASSFDCANELCNLERANERLVRQDMGSPLTLLMQAACCLGLIGCGNLNSCHKILKTASEFPQRLCEQNVLRLSSDNSTLLYVRALGQTWFRFCCLQVLVWRLERQF